MKTARLDEMEQHILAQDYVTMDGLCEKFGISMITARRDVMQLTGKGTVEKVYGGVMARKSDQLMPFSDRNTKNMEAKDRIGKRAAELVSAGDVIFLDSGTTAHHLIRHLANKENITIVTHNLQAIVAALPFEQLNVIVLPGQLFHKTNSITGVSTLQALNSYNFRLSFMAASGVSADFGVTNSSPLEYELKKLAMARGEKTVLMMDGDKFGRSAMLTYARLSDFDAITTDKMPPEPYLEEILSGKMELLLAK